MHKDGCKQCAWNYGFYAVDAGSALDNNETGYYQTCKKTSWIPTALASWIGMFFAFTFLT